MRQIVDEVAGWFFILLAGSGVWSFSWVVRVLPNYRAEAQAWFPIVALLIVALIAVCLVKAATVFMLASPARRILSSDRPKR